MRRCASLRSRKIGLAIVSSPRRMFSATVRHRHEHEVLVDHADPAGDGVGRAVDRDRLAVEQDLALVGDGQPVQDVHEGRLAGAVLAEQGMDLARPEVEVDVVVGEHARIALRDAPHLERRHGRRCAVRHVGLPQRIALDDDERAGRSRPARQSVAVGWCPTACRRPPACTDRACRPSCRRGPRRSSTEGRGSSWT